MGKHSKAPKLVYFARRADGTGPIKIGCSISPKHRIAQLCTDMRERIVVLASAPGGFREECRLHRQFAEHALGGEWFTPVPELLAAVDHVARRGNLPPVPASDRDVVIAARYLGGETLQSIASDYGVTRERIRQLLRAQGVPSLGLREEHRSKAHPLSDEEIAAAEMYREGRLVKDILAAFPDLKIHQLNGAVQRLGIPKRPCGALPRADDAERTASVVELYSAGIPGPEIVRHLPWLKHQARIYYYLKKAGVAPRIRGRVKDRLERMATQIIAAYRGGKTIPEVAAAFDASCNGINNLLTRHSAKLSRDEVERRRVLRVRLANKRRWRERHVAPESAAA